MNFKELTEEEISDFIVNDPRLAYLGFADKELMYMYENKKYNLHDGSIYTGIEEDGKLICIIKWEYFTLNCISVHPYISSHYHGKGLSRKIGQFMQEQLSKNTAIVKVVSFIMEPCEHAVRAAVACGFKLEGHITNCTHWRQELTGVYIYGVDINREDKHETK